MTFFWEKLKFFSSYAYTFKLVLNILRSFIVTIMFCSKACSISIWYSQASNILCCWRWQSVCGLVAGNFGSNYRLCKYTLQYNEANEFSLATRDIGMVYKSGIWKTYLPNVMVEWLTLVFRIQEVPGSNLGPEISCPNWDFSWFSQSLEANTRRIP
jgi:hypothetical protein